jgi:hypothetical protein
MAPPRFKQAPIVEDETEDLAVAVPKFKQAPVVEQAPTAPVQPPSLSGLKGKEFFEGYLGADYAPFKSLPSGGQVYKNQNTGELAYYSPKFETYDKKAVEKLLLGASEDFVKKEQGRLLVGRESVKEQPVMSRLQQITKGTFLAGQSVDELKGAVRGEEAKEAFRAQTAAFEEDRPVEAGAYQVLGAVLSTPMRTVGIGSKWLEEGIQGIGSVQRMASGAVRGFIAGSAEGAAQGAGRAEGGLEERLEGAGEGAIVGGLVGAPVGAAAEPFGQVISNVQKLFGRTAAPKIAQELKLSEEAAKQLSAAFLRSDFAAARRILQDAGETGMLADAGVVTRNLVDNAIISGSEVAANVAQTQVTPRIKFLSNKLNRVMDNILGKPKYMEELLEEIQAGARSPQKQLYDAANRIRIPRGTPEGQTIYARMEDQIPQSYIDALNNSYRIRAEDPSNIRQLIRTKDPKTGKVILSDDLTVEDIDLIVRRMQEDAVKLHKDVNPLGFGVSALKSSDGVALENLAMSLRADARKLSKEYDAALTMAKDTIQTRQAAMLGETLLDKNTRMPDVAEALARATPEERAAMKAGLRSEINDIILNTRVTMNSPDFEVNSVRDLWSKFNNPAAMEKVSAVLGKKEADKLYEVYREAQVAYGLQAAIVKGSQTAGRLEQARMQEQINAPGVLQLLGLGQWDKAFQRAVQSLTGMRPEQIQMRRADQWDEISKILTQTQGPDAFKALDIIEQALAGQKVTNQQVKVVTDAIRKAFAKAIPATERVVGEDVGRELVYNPETDDFE